MAGGGLAVLQRNRTVHSENRHKGACELRPLWWPDPQDGMTRGANRHNIRRYSAKSRFSSNVVMVFTALRHDPNAGVQTAAVPQEPPSRPYPPR